MMNPSTEMPLARNALYSLAAVGGVLLGLFLLAGASGHFIAVWPSLDSAVTPSLVNRFNLLKPGLILLTTGLINIGVCRGLWMGKNWALQLALGCNVFTMIYFGWLLTKGVPDHPIGVFLASAASYVVLLGAIRVGLVWPAARKQ